MGNSLDAGVLVGTWIGVLWILLTAVADPRMTCGLSAPVQAITATATEEF
jgi:hypothetical protein